MVEPPGVEISSLSFVRLVAGIVASQGQFDLVLDRQLLLLIHCSAVAVKPGRLPREAR
jgi:hypothetical protein